MHSSAAVYMPECNIVGRLGRFMVIVDIVGIKVGRDNNEEPTLQCNTRNLSYYQTEQRESVLRTPSHNAILLSVKAAAHCRPSVLLHCMYHSLIYSHKLIAFPLIYTPRAAPKLTGISTNKHKTTSQHPNYQCGRLLLLNV